VWRSVSAMASGTQVGHTLVLRRKEERGMDAIMIVRWRLEKLTRGIYEEYQVTRCNENTRSSWI